MHRGISSSIEEAVRDASNALLGGTPSSEHRNGPRCRLPAPRLDAGSARACLTIKSSSKAIEALASSVAATGVSDGVLPPSNNES